MSSIEKPSSPLKVVIIGQGYVGLPISMAAVDAGHDVVGFEIDANRSAKLVAGSSYVEDITDDELQAALASGRFLATSNGVDLKGFDIAVITVPTPLREGIPDLSFIEIATRQLAPLLTQGSTVILESTTYPGTTEELVGPILEDESGLKAGESFHLGYSPERIDPGNKSWGLRNTPKVVSGVNEASLRAVDGFYSSIIDTTVPVGSCRVAELSKLIENTFRHVNIALVNELAIFADALDVDVWEAIAAAKTKPFGFMGFTPGPGVGGHCLPVDPSYLSWKVEQTVGHPFRFIDLANNINDHMPDFVISRVIRILNDHQLAVNGSRILVLGLAYKPNTGDARESPGPIVCRLLRELKAEVRAADPHLDAARFPSDVTAVELNEDEVRSADLTLLITDHDSFDWELIAAGSKQILDTRHRLEPATNVSYL